ncbi:hypothetical protein AXX17_AT2G09890 [Arabidopsis thaliana]|uniref:Uncharacterized protein n=1 Tax=Arabidopsis thaliana TaxID=3702 RepID=A0A178VQB4_ARATH|nr:hypothetical protein AXX17_AT2G09890 [Arabidopsis thaliana]
MIVVFYALSSLTCGWSYQMSFELQDPEDLSGADITCTRRHHKQQFVLCDRCG